MIISASRRTDIPAFYWEWFQKRLQEQYVLVRNPLNLHQVSRISLRPEVVDGLVFWTKNPEPMLKQLSVLDAYAYYFQFTLNAYAADVEAALPPLAVRIEIFRQLAQKTGAERMIWRYDPILLSARYDLQYHAAVFEELAAQLAGSTKKCIISFLDYYPKIKAGLHQAGLRGLSEDEQRRLAAVLSQTARQYGLQLETCAEAIELADLGIEHASCIDAELLGRVGGCRLDTVKDKNQRGECGCAASIDIGAYNTCLHGCIYCYANDSRRQLQQITAGNSSSPLLCSELEPADKVTERNLRALRSLQAELFKYRFCCQTAGINFLKKLLDLELTPLDMIQIRNGSSGILVMSGRNKKQVIWRFCSSADCVFSYNGFERRTM